MTVCTDLTLSPSTLVSNVGQLMKVVHNVSHGSGKPSVRVSGSYCGGAWWGVTRQSDWHPYIQVILIKTLDDSSTWDMWVLLQNKANLLLWIFACAHIIMPFSSLNASSACNCQYNTHSGWIGPIWNLEHLPYCTCQGKELVLWVSM